MKPEELKAIRAKAKLTQEQLAHVLGVSVHTVIAWEKGKNPINKLSEFAIKLAMNDKDRKDRIKTEFKCDWEIKHLGKKGKRENTVVFTGFKEEDIKDEILHAVTHDLEKEYDAFEGEITIKNFKMSKLEHL